MKKLILLLVLMTSFAFVPNYGDGKKPKPEVKIAKSDGRCSGGKYCSACKNCNYCKNCNSGGICGVCSPESFVEKKAKPVKKKAPAKKTTTKK